MNPHWNSYLNRKLSRRDLLRTSSTGFGALALAGLLGEELRAAGPLSVKPPLVRAILHKMNKAAGQLRGSQKREAARRSISMAQKARRAKVKAGQEVEVT